MLNRNAKLICACKALTSARAVAFCLAIKLATRAAWREKLTPNLNNCKLRASQFPATTTIVELDGANRAVLNNQRNNDAKGAPPFASSALWYLLTTIYRGQTSPCVLSEPRLQGQPLLGRHVRGCQCLPQVQHVLGIRDGNSDYLQKFLEAIVCR